MPKLKNILIGWMRLGLDEFNLLSDELKELSDQRIGICTGCSLREGNSCSTEKSGKAIKSLEYEDEQRYKGIVYSGCGCLLDAKTLVDDEKCPLGKW